MTNLKLVKPSRAPERRLKKIKARIHNDLHAQLSSLLDENMDKIIFLLAQGWAVRVKLDVQSPEKAAELTTAPESEPPGR